MKLLRHTAKQHFNKVEVFQVSEVFLGRLQKFFADTGESRVMVIVGAGNFSGGYQTLLRLVQAVEAEKHYLTDIASDCPLDEDGQIRCYILEAQAILDYALGIIRDSHDS